MSVRRDRFQCPKTGKERFYWRVDIVFEHPDGSVQRVRKTSPVNTRKGAEQYERQIRQKLLDGTYTRRRKEKVPEKDGPTVPTFKTFSKEFMTVYVQTNNKPSEVQSKESILRRHLLPAFRRKRLDEIGQRDIERYKSKKLALDLSPKTINNQLTVLRRLLAVAVEWGIIPMVPPIKWLRVPPQSFDFLDFEETERLLAAAEEEWRPMITLAYRSGLRQGELLALRWGDVDLAAGQLVVRRAVARGFMGTPKNGRTRSIPLSEATVAELKRALLPFGRGRRKRVRLKAGEGERRDEDLVFCDSMGNLLSKGSCKWPLWRACAKAGLRRIGWHVARHSFASHLVMRGVPLKVVQELLGHQTIQMTERYSHMTPDVRRGAIELLEGEPELRPNNGQTAGVKDADERK